MYTKLLSLLCALLCSLLSLTTTANSYENFTPEEYIKTYSGNSKTDMAKASEGLAWAGLSDPKLFDIIEKNLLADLPSAKKDRKIADYTSWLIKALSFSGNPKYKATLENIAKNAPSKTNRKWAKKSLPVLQQYAVFNPLIAPKAWPQYSQPNLDQRLLNMLASDNLELMRIAAKRVYYPNNRDPKMLSAINDAVLRNYQTSKKDRLHTDSMAWLCKALANSQSADYRSTVEKVAKDAPSKKLRSYAKKYVKQYYL